MKSNNAFNWSDEELLDEYDKKESRKKGKQNKNSLPKVRGGKSQ